MKLTIAAGQSNQIQVAAPHLIVLSASAAFEVVGDKLGEVTLKQGEQVNLVDSRYVRVQNLSSETSLEVEIEFAATARTAQRETVEISKMPAVSVEATVAAAATANDPINLTLLAGQSHLVMAANPNRHNAIITRGETDLYNIKLGYNSAVNAQNGIPVAPQATVEIDNKAAVYAHNHSTETQYLTAIETNIAGA